MTHSGTPSTRSPRPESREVTELRAVSSRHPELAGAVDLHVELLELQRRIQGRVPLPSLELTAGLVQRHNAAATPLLRFEIVPLELTDLRLMVRQTADVLRRHGTLEDADYQIVQTLGRGATLLAEAERWFRSTGDRPVTNGGAATAANLAATGGSGVLGEVLTLAMRPFLLRCAEVVQQRPELSIWTHAHCALCGGEPDLSVITSSAERHLICGRCGLRWKWEPLDCPFCLNRDRTRITSFATPDGQYRVYACDVCHRYLKAYDGRRSRRPVMPVVDGVATLPLDAAAIQRGYSSS